MAETTSWPRRLVNSGFLATASRIERSIPFRSPTQIERLQRRRLRAMVRHAYGTVPYYREEMDRLGLRPDDIRCADDLAKLPLIERDQLNRDPEVFVSTERSRDRYLKLRSGGSTGARCTVYHDPMAIIANAAHGERERSIYTRIIGRAVGYRETVIATPVGSAHEIRHFIQTHTLLPAGVRIERRFVSLLDPPDAIARQIDEFKPDLLHGFGSALEMVYGHQRAGGAGFHRPRVVTYSSDALSPAARRVIEEENGVPVFGTYQAIEALKIAFECDRHRGYHLNVDLYPVRVVDAEGRAVADGETGEVVVSNLVNRATVLLNYRIGDLAAILPEPCGCGRSLPLLSFLEGRSDDVIALPSGRVVHPQALRSTFIVETEIARYQVVQEEPARFVVAVVASSGADRSGLRERIVAGLGERLVDPVTIEVAFVAAIARAPSGKIRPIISKRHSGWSNPTAEEPTDA